jgi:hypothetical protein
MNVNGALVEDKMRRFRGECAHFSFKNVPFLLLLLLNYMLPDITSNTWAKTFFNFFYEQNIQITICHHDEGGEAGVLVTAIVAAAAARATAGGAAGRAVAALVVAIAAGGAGRAVPVAMVAGFATSCTATVAAASKVR